jgi:hypothetical protein
MKTKRSVVEGDYDQEEVVLKVIRSRWVVEDDEKSAIEEDDDQEEDEEEEESTAPKTNPLPCTARKQRLRKKSGKSDVSFD